MGPCGGGALGKPRSLERTSGPFCAGASAGERPGRTRSGPGWGGVAKVTPCWAGCGRWPGHHERPEAELHLGRLRRVGVKVLCGSFLGAMDPWWEGVRRLRRTSIQVVSGMSELPRALLGIHVHA